ncbi:MAG TPA: hypothetical protein VGB43_08740 [Flavobacterium sp.]|jgi:hypothetical protein
MKTRLLILLLGLSTICLGQEVTVNGVASDTNNGAFVIEIVRNDTLAKIMRDPKAGRPKYLKLLHDPSVVVRTDSTGIFSIRARVSDSLYFKSYNHKKERHLVRDLMKLDKIIIKLQPEIDPED